MSQKDNIYSKRLQNFFWHDSCWQPIPLGLQ